MRIISGFLRYVDICSHAFRGPENTPNIAAGMDMMYDIYIADTIACW